MRLILVRHGESQHNVGGFIAGLSGCRGLTGRGLSQARALAERIRKTDEWNDCGALLCSPMRRATQTAEILRDALPVTKAEADDGLCELHPGKADGLSWDDYCATYGTFDLVAFPTRPFSPGGENWSDFLSRVRATLERLAARFAGQTVVAVTHGGFIVASILVLFDIPRPGTGAHLEPAHLSLTEWNFSEGIWRLARFNDQ